MLELVCYKTNNSSAIYLKLIKKEWIHCNAVLMSYLLSTLFHLLQLCDPYIVIELDFRIYAGSTNIIN